MRLQWTNEFYLTKDLHTHSFLTSCTPTVKVYLACLSCCNSCCVVLVCNWGQEWEVGELHTRTQYKAFYTNEITADVGVKIGLRNVNITLKGSFHVTARLIWYQHLNYGPKMHLLCRPRPITCLSNPNGNVRKCTCTCVCVLLTFQYCICAYSCVHKLMLCLLHGYLTIYIYNVLGVKSTRISVWS